MTGIHGSSTEISVGEEVDNLIASDLETRVRVADDKPAEVAPVKRVLITPPQTVVKSNVVETTSSTSSTAVSLKENTTSTTIRSNKYVEGHERIFGDKKSTADKLWLTCKVCDKRANIAYFDEHIKMHTSEFIDNLTSRAVSSSASNKNAIPLANLSKPLEPLKPAVPRVSNVPKYRFRKIEKCVAIASTSVNKRYSDFAVVFVLETKPSLYNTSYVSGPSTSVYKDFERMSIHVVYDSVDDFYLVSSKILKRSSHSSYDVEDDAKVPERICYQEEILTEVRRAMLFLGIDPKNAYRHFRRMLRDSIIDEVDDKDRVLVSKTSGFADFQEALKKNAGSWNNNTNMSEAWGHGC
jgi:hypothetical protein